MQLTGGQEHFVEVKGMLHKWVQRLFWGPTCHQVVPDQLQTSGVTEHTRQFVFTHCLTFNWLFFYAANGHPQFRECWMLNNYWVLWLLKMIKTFNADDRAQTVKKHFPEKITTQLGFHQVTLAGGWLNINHGNTLYGVYWSLKLAWVVCGTRVLIALGRAENLTTTWHSQAGKLMSTTQPCKCQAHVLSIPPWRQFFI